MHLTYVLAPLLHGLDQNVMYRDVMVLQQMTLQMSVLDEELVLLLMFVLHVLVILVDLAVNFLFVTGSYRMIPQMCVQVVERVWHQMFVHLV